MLDFVPNPQSFIDPSDSAVEPALDGGSAPAKSRGVITWLSARTQNLGMFVPEDQPQINPLQGVDGSAEERFDEHGTPDHRETAYEVAGLNQTIPEILCCISQRS